MLSIIVSGALLGVSTVFAAPFTFPLPNGFPDIAIPSPELLAIEVQAHGTLPNTPLLTSLAPDDIVTFQVIAEQEIFEVAFYTSLLWNITHNVPGYEISPPSVKKYVISVFTAIRAQEELHALGANAILAAAGAETIEPCAYVFGPAVSYDTAIDTARTFTDVVLGVLPAVQLQLATLGDEGYIPLLGSIIGNEAEQVGFFREQLGLIPSELPFLTASNGLFGWSALNQNFIVPGSCPNPPPVPILPPLALVTPTPILPKDQLLTFSFAIDDTGVDTSAFYLVYINQQNLPIVEEPQNVQVAGDVVTFEADFPYTENLLNGLTQALVTSSPGPFANAAEVAAVTLYGPALIEVN